MDRNEFISILRTSLQSMISDAAVEENVEYYYHYISDEIAKGKSEQEVLDMLGDPRLIARTIINAGGGTSRSGRSYTYTEPSSERPSKRFNSREDEGNSSDIHLHQIDLSTWYGKLLVIVIILLVLALIFTIVGGILSLIMPVLFPVLIIILIIRLFTRRR